MTDRSYETSTVFREIVAELGELEAKLLDPANALDDPSVLEGYRWIFSILQVAFDAYVWADKQKPRFVDIVGPYKKWGGDNADAFYQYAPIDPRRTYRVRGKRGDAVYLSLTVYGGPDDGRYSERIVGTLNDRMLAIDAQGHFELVLSPDPHPGAWLKLEPDAVCAITRDYMTDPVGGRRAEWQIECLDPCQPYRESDADLARRFRATLTWLRDQSRIVPIPAGEPNTIEEPYPVPKVTFGWAAGDAAYALGTFALADDEALIITGRSPDCRFWNMCLWNRLLHTYNYDYERCTINGEQVKYNSDGSWTIVIAHRDPGHPNWVSPAGHASGRIWFRWFYPAETPTRLAARVAKASEVGALDACRA